MKANYTQKKDSMFEARETIKAAIANEDNRNELKDNLFNAISNDTRVLTPDGRRQFTIAWLSGLESHVPEIKGVSEDEGAIQYVLDNLINPVCDKINENSSREDIAEALKNAKRTGKMNIFVRITSFMVNLVKKILGLIKKFFHALKTAFCKVPCWVRDRFVDFEAFLADHRFIAFLLDCVKSGATGYGIGCLAKFVGSKLGFTGAASIGLLIAALVVGLAVNKLINYLTDKIRNWASVRKHARKYSDVYEHRAEFDIEDKNDVVYC